MEKMRIQKYLSLCGVTSRRAAEDDIKKGFVYVNGKLCGIGQTIDPAVDTVTYKGKKVALKRENDRIYVMLNKPRGYITTMSDELGRKTVLDLVSDIPERIYPIGRLDRDSEGLLLMTNDGELTNILTHPTHKIPKIYHVKFKGKITDEQLEILRSPLVIDGYKIRPVKTEIIRLTDNETVLEFTLFEGRNRQIRKMAEAAGLRIQRLTRIAVGNIKLGNLAPGKYKYLTGKQVKYLKESED